MTSSPLPQHRTSSARTPEVPTPLTLPKARTCTTLLLALIPRLLLNQPLTSRREAIFTTPQRALQAYSRVPPLTHSQRVQRISTTPTHVFRVSSIRFQRGTSSQAPPLPTTSPRTASQDSQLPPPITGSRANLPLTSRREAISTTPTHA